MSNIEQLKMFVESAQAGSFSASARKLGKAQSAVSQAISNLEIDLGVTLFDRTTRKPTLTANGSLLLAHAKAVLQQSLELSMAADAMNRDEEVSLTIACDSALLLPRFFQILQAFSQHYPATSIELMTVDSADIISLIAKGKAELGCMFSDTELSPLVDFCFIGHLPFTPVCSPSHQLASNHNTTLIELIQHRQIMQRGESGSMPEQFPEISPNIWWSNDFENVLAMVKQSLGWAYLPSHYLQRQPPNEQLHTIPVSFDHKEWAPPVDLITSKKQAMGPALTWLHQQLKSVLD